MTFFAKYLLFSIGSPQPIPPQGHESNLTPTDNYPKLVVFNSISSFSHHGGLPWPGQWAVSSLQLKGSFGWECAINATYQTCRHCARARTLAQDTPAESCRQKEKITSMEDAKIIMGTLSDWNSKTRRVLSHGTLGYSAERGYHQDELSHEAHWARPSNGVATSLGCLYQTRACQ